MRLGACFIVSLLAGCAAAKELDYHDFDSVKMPAHPL